MEVTTVRMSLSPSRAGDFQTCPLLYRFRTIDRLPEPPDATAVRGTLVHAVLEDLFGEAAPGRTLERAAEILPADWARLQEERPELTELFDGRPDDEAAWLTSAVSLLESYFALENPQWVEPTERELRVVHQLEDGPGLTGIVDRVDIAPDGRIRVVDYKSGRSAKPGYEDKALFQMKFYALVIWRTRGVIPTLLQLLYLGDRSRLEYSPTEQDLLATERKVRALWSAIQAAFAKGEFPPNPGPLCNWCAHKSLCPAFDGTPPPMPAFELVPLEESS